MKLTKEGLEKQKQERIGEIRYNKHGSKMKIHEYIDSMNVVIKFENGYTTKNTYNAFKKEEIKNPYDKTVFNTGYIGEGKYKVSTNRVFNNIYKLWKRMMGRCYDISYINKYPTYKDCSVCEEWHNYQNFAKWHDENYYKIEGEEIHLDKDILIKGNKIYSPDTCIFVPDRINYLFIKANKSRGKYPIGVNYNKQSKKFIATCTPKYLGLFNTPEEAFEVYKNCKENLIRKIANEYKDKIPQKLYDVLINYQVEITD